MAPSAANLCDYYNSFCIFSASSVGLSSMLGFLISSYLMDICGRRLAFALSIMPGTIAWVFIYFAQDVTTLMIGRILGGISGGATVSLGAIILGEYTSPENRGMFLNLKSAAVCVGNMIVHLLNNYYDWRRLALFGFVPYIGAFCIVSTWPESPAWLASKGQFEKSESSFIWLRGSSERAAQELNELIKAQKEHISSTDKTNLLDSMKIFFIKFARKDFVKPLTIVIFAGILSEASGRHVFPAYASQIIGNITGEKSQSFYYTLSIDLIITSSVTLSSVLVRIMKRRVLLFSTAVASVIVLTSVCLYLYLASINVVPIDKPWIPLTMLIVYFVLANLCCTPMPYIIIGEVFPLEHKGAGTAVTGISLSLLLMVGLKITPYLLIGVNISGTFAVFGGVTAFSLLVMYYILPETKDRTLQEIENYFNNGKFECDNKDDEAKRKMMHVTVDRYKD